MRVRTIETDVTVILKSFAVVAVDLQAPATDRARAVQLSGPGRCESATDQRNCRIVLPAGRPDDETTVQHEPHHQHVHHPGGESNGGRALDKLRHTYPAGAVRPTGTAS